MTLQHSHSKAAFKTPSPRPPQVDGVVVVTPNIAHASAAIAAAKRGLHVLVEKPMALTDEECSQMIAAADAAGVLCAVLHCMHWSPALTAAREAVASGKAHLAPLFPAPKLPPPLPPPIPPLRLCTLRRSCAGAIGRICSAIFTASFDGGLDTFNIKVKCLYILN